MSLRLRLSLFFSLTVSLLLAVICTVTFSIVKSEELRKAGDLLLDHMEHEWSHLALSHGHPSEGPNTLADPDVFIQVLKNGRPLSGVMPSVENSFAGVVHRSWKRKIGSDEFELLGLMRPRKTYQYLRTLRNALISGCLLGVLLVAPLGWAFTGTLLRPFRELSKKTAELDAKHLSFRFPAPLRSDEYGTLVGSFNSLLTRLEKSFAQIRRFATNASHELRTPITVIRGEAELALRKERDIEEYERVLDRIHGQSIMLQGTVARLLALADVERMEQQHAERGAIAVKRTVTDAIEALQRVYPQSQKIVQLNGEETQYLGQAEIFGSVVTNLIENAMKFSRERVNVHFYKDGGGIHLRIEDDGAGVGESERAAVFEPFVRGVSGKQLPGHGLGLAIVKACVDAVRGKITLANSTLGGLRVDVFLPEGLTASV